jgi:SAM-dependent methyltransferase
MPEANAEFQDYLSRHYAHIGDQARFRSARKRQLQRTYVEVLPADRAAEMLEIGPGYGQWLELLRKDLGYTHAVAIDVSHEVVAFCNQLLPGSTSHVADTVAMLAANPARFERIFVLHVLEHLPKPVAQAWMRALLGALRPGGQLVVEVPNMANFMTNGYLRWADLTHEAGYSELSLRVLLESGGFTDCRCFEDRLPGGSVKSLAAGVFRGAARWLQRTVYRGYELPVPQVLTPSLCAVASRPPERP